MAGPQDRFNGTLFRFPLRDAVAAAASDIKATPTTPADVLGLFEALRGALPAALLFLKSVRRVEVWVSGGAGSGSGGPTDEAGGAGSAAANGPGGAGVRLLFQAHVQLPDSGARPAAGGPQAPILQFISGSGTAAGGSGKGGPEQGTAAAGPASLDAFYARLAAARPEQLPASCTHVRLVLDEGDGGSAGALEAQLQSQPPLQQQQALRVAVDESWLVANVLAGGSARSLALAAWKGGGVKMVPWVGVAARLASSGAAAPPVDAPVSGQQRQAAPAGGGRAFCFLPLPGGSGLPVHVNGFFELSSNRCAPAQGGCVLACQMPK